MRRTAVIASLALPVALAAAVPAGANHDGSLPARYIVPGQNVFPEGIARVPGTRTFFVSATSNGAIYRGNLDRPRMHVFLPGGQDGRTFATGLEVRRGALYVSGADTGRIFIYDARTGERRKAFRTGQGGFINDVAITPAGGAFFTDSLRPVLWRVSKEAAAEPGRDFRRLHPWMSFEGTPLQYVDGFNLNGIVSSPRGKYLFVVQSNTGRLWRIERATKEVTAVPIAGGDLTAGDGMLLRGRTLYVAQNAFNRITKVRLARNFSRGEIVGAAGDSSFSTPTTMEVARGHLMVVNAQFNANPPAPPFTVSTIPLF